MEYSYPLLTKVATHYRTVPHDVKDLYLVCCQHLLEPQKQMFEELISFGFEPSKILLLGKIYSTNSEILKELLKLGIQAEQPEFSGEPFDKEHQRNCIELLRKVPVGAPCILLDDGAQLIQSAIDIGTNAQFGVEQTSSGFRKLENVEVPFPVLNVARSAIKLLQESPHVARHAGERLKEYLQDKGAQGRSVLVVGLGPIGEAMQNYLEQEGFTVEGFDIRHGHSGLIELIKRKRPSVIIGATGSAILTSEELEQVAEGDLLYLVSLSSSDREFPVASFRNGIRGTHIDIRYKGIVFVNNGFPISFMGNRNEATPFEMEKTMCLLGGSVMYGSMHPELKAGLQSLPEELENIVNS